MGDQALGARRREAELLGELLVVDQHACGAIRRSMRSLSRGGSAGSRCTRFRPSLEQAIRISTGERWLRHMTATVSRAREAACGQTVGERARAPVELGEAQGAVIVDDRRPCAGSRSRRVACGRGGGSPATQRAVGAQRLVGAGVGAGRRAGSATAPASSGARSASRASSFQFGCRDLRVWPRHPMWPARGGDPRGPSPGGAPRGARGERAHNRQRGGHADYAVLSSAPVSISCSPETQL